ncbi:glutathione S-transferase [Blastomyces dermatitidis ER-3]|uniref:Glutathione S-transferase n=1 Tax=Ajellomyces dermatitidis (strain ER-3 / ATCC MYA-2586) TaxID=559297 RepID=A0ABX2VPY4_AJEDR|nr:glutathione S-transferase [Blastomyces dermatitidis ER-3]OAS99323.1 glutathione S-transferase [Blastomyces dermatitidis ER-3]
MVTTITLPDNYGNVLALAVGVIPLLNFVHIFVVGKNRQKSGIRYPHAYATPEECKQNPAAHRFNCAQRAHSNFLEHMPLTTLSALVAGLKYPSATIALTGTWIVMRALYMYGYVYSDKPYGKGRYIGALHTFAQLGLWGLSAFGVAFSMVKGDNFWGSRVGEVRQSPAPEPIIALEKYFTRNQGAIYGKPDENDAEAWKLMIALFRMCQDGLKYISKEDGLTPDERLQLSGFHHWESYFKKAAVAVAMNEVDNILKVSWSPQCRHLFRYEFNLHAVPATMSKAHTIPQKCEGLGRRFRKSIVTTKQITQRNPP